MALLATLTIALAMAVPTAILENPWFTRMTPVEPDQYFFWIATSIVMGLLVASYLPSVSAGPRGRGSGAGAGVLTTLAIGCPICNKVVVAVMGVSGAFSYFAPVQPLLGAVGLVLALLALTMRVRGLPARECRIEANAGPPARGPAARE